MSNNLINQISNSNQSDRRQSFVGYYNINTVGVERNLIVSVIMLGSSKRGRHFGGSSRLHIQGRKLNQVRNKTFWEELIAYFPWYDTGHIEKDASTNSSIAACVFVTAVTFQPSRCIAMIKGFFTEPLPSNRQQRDLISLPYFF
jgi:hypothetical protein